MRNLFFIFLLLITFNTPAKSTKIYLTTDINCLAANIYKEARGEPLEGQIEVGLVTINRVKDPRWPSSICEVVKQHKQFSWYKNNKYIEPKNSKLWEAIMLVSKAILDKDNAIYNRGSLYFINYKTATYIKWTQNLANNITIKNHKFYTD